MPITGPTLALAAFPEDLPLRLRGSPFQLRVHLNLTGIVRMSAINKVHEHIPDRGSWRGTRQKFRHAGCEYRFRNFGKIVEDLL